MTSAFGGQRSDPAELRVRDFPAIAEHLLCCNMIPVNTLATILRIVKFIHLTLAG